MNLNGYNSIFPATGNLNKDIFSTIDLASAVNYNLKYYPHLYQKYKNYYLDYDRQKVDRLYTKNPEANSFYSTLNIKIPNDGSVKYSLSGNVLFCTNYGNILKLSKYNLRYIISNCTIDKGVISTPLIILKAKNGWRVVTLHSEQAKHSIANQDKRIKKKTKFVKMDNKWNTGDIKIDFQVNSDLIKSFNNLKYFTDFKCWTNPSYMIPTV